VVNPGFKGFLKPILIEKGLEKRALFLANLTIQA
jgi:hypothetical protein